ncbi:MAG TPA: acyl-ACP--UDP-N-acetylglucosamine O-acyltransferase [Exilispira sp.]|nr:acyl-ACP--UDP-N-acetylglucosamine O-acyltransferase [Exilispira sp.]
MNKIDKTAKISNDLVIGDGNQIGSNVIIKEGCVIGNNNIILDNAIIGPYVKIGDNNEIGHYSYLGGDPQDHDYIKNSISFVEIGNNNIIREYVTIHRGTKENSKTIIKDNNFLMAYTHFGHNVIVGSNCTFTNLVQLAGYVEVEDNVVMGGISGAHQFCKIGAYSMIGAKAYINKDILPYSLVFGIPAQVIGINFIGLRRAGFTAEDREAIKTIFHIIYNSGLGFSKAIEKISNECKDDKFAQKILDFIKKSNRGLASFGYNKSENG